MSLKLSTGLRNKLLDTGSLRSVLNLGFINIYDGAVPATADDAIAGGNTLLCTISVNDTGVGLTFEAAAADGILAKAVAEIWSGITLANGTASFYRHVAVADTGALSTTQARIQGEIAQVGAELNLSTTTFATPAVRSIDYYVVAIPTL